MCNHSLNFFSLFRPTVLCVDFCTRFKNLMAQKQSYFVPRKSVVVDDGSAETHLFTFLKTEKNIFFKKYNFWLRSSSTKFLFFISVQHQCKIIWGHRKCLVNYSDWLLSIKNSRSKSMSKRRNLSKKYSNE